MKTASIKEGIKKDSPSMENIDELPVSFFDYFEWSRDAKCLGVESSTFFSASSTKIAKTICGLCPVKRQCFTWALIYKEDGVWGGTTAQERRQLLSAYNTKALICRAMRLGVYYPKRSVEQIQQSLAEAG